MEGTKHPVHANKSVQLGWFRMFSVICYMCTCQHVVSEVGQNPFETSKLLQPIDRMWNNEWLLARPVTARPQLLPWMLVFPQDPGQCWSESRSAITVPPAGSLICIHSVQDFACSVRNNHTYIFVMPKRLWRKSRFYFLFHKGRWHHNHWAHQ